MSKKNILLLLVYATPIVALAAESDYLYDFELLPRIGENILEGLNLLIAIFAAAFAVKLAALSQGGSLEKTWNFMAIASLFFAALEIYGASKGLGILHLGGLDDILELGFGLMLAITFYRTRKQLLAKALG